MPAKARLVVLISGSGSNLQALLDASAAGTLPADIVHVVSNRAGAYGLERARQRNIPATVFRRQKGTDRTDYDAALGQFVADLKPDWVILAGWMHILSMNFLGHFPNRVVNLHPALPGQFAGTHAIERAFEAFQRGEIGQTGVMVHLVPDEGVDVGPVLASEAVPIFQEDTVETLEERIHAVEHRLLVDTVRRLIEGELP